MPISYLYQMIIPENIHTTNIQTEQVIFRNRYVCIYIVVTIISGERGHEFEREKQSVYRKVWREVQEQINDVIKHYNLERIIKTLKVVSVGSLFMFYNI